MGTKIPPTDYGTTKQAFVNVICLQWQKIQRRHLIYIQILYF